MKRTIRIAGLIVALLVLVGAGGFIWMLLKPHPPSEIVEPGPTGTNSATIKPAILIVRFMHSCLTSRFCTLACTARYRPVVTR